MAKAIKNLYSISLPLRVDQGLRGYGDRGYGDKGLRWGLRGYGDSALYTVCSASPFAFGLGPRGSGRSVLLNAVSSREINNSPPRGRPIVSAFRNGDASASSSWSSSKSEKRG